MWIISCCCLVAFSFAVNVFTVQRRCFLASTSNHYHLLPNLQVWLAFLYFLANQGKPTPVHNWFLWRFRTRWTHSAASDVFSPLWQVGIENKLWNSPGWFLPPEGFVGCYKDARYTFQSLKIVFHPEPKTTISIVSSRDWVGANHRMITVIHYKQSLRTFQEDSWISMFLFSCYSPEKKCVRGVLCWRREHKEKDACRCSNSPVSPPSPGCAVDSREPAHEHGH